MKPPARLFSGAALFTKYARFQANWHGPNTKSQVGGRMLATMNLRVLIQRKLWRWGSGEVGRSTLLNCSWDPACGSTVTLGSLSANSARCWSTNCSNSLWNGSESWPATHPVSSNSMHFLANPEHPRLLHKTLVSPSLQHDCFLALEHLKAFLNLMNVKNHALTEAKHFQHDRASGRTEHGCRVADLGWLCVRYIWHRKVHSRKWVGWICHHLEQRLLTPFLALKGNYIQFEPQKNVNEHTVLVSLWVVRVCSIRLQCSLLSHWLCVRHLWRHAT